MNPETKLELIALLARDEGWKAVLVIGNAILDEWYPAAVFTGESGDPGPVYIAALREALKNIGER